MPATVQSTARDQRIIAAFAAGRTILQIALDEGFTQHTIRQILRRHGISGPGLRTRTPPSPAVTARLNDADWLAAEYATKNVPQIAREVGATPTQVRNALERAGIPCRSRRQAALLSHGLKGRAVIQEGEQRCTWLVHP